MSNLLRRIKEGKFKEQVNSGSRQTGVVNLKLDVKDVNNDIIRPQYIRSTKYFYEALPELLERGGEALKGVGGGVRTLKSLDGETFKSWKSLFGSSTLKELELVKRILERECLVVNSYNTTKMLNKIFKAEHSGYIIQTPQHSHVWEVNKENIILREILEV